MREPVHVTSAQNPRIKDASALRDRKARERAGLLLVEGAREIGRALASGFEVDTLFFCPELLSPEARPLLARLAGARATSVSDHVFDKLALREGSDGLVVTLRQRPVALDQVLAPRADRAPLVFALHGVEKPGNLGAILRTADGIGASGVVLLEGTGDA